MYVKLVGIVQENCPGGFCPRWKLSEGNCPGGAIVLGGNCPGGNFLGGNFPEGSFPWENCSGRNCPRTDLSILSFLRRLTV